MKGDMYYKSSWPKELRIEIENEDELKFLRLIFSQNPEHTLKKYKGAELAQVGLDDAWKNKFVTRMHETYNKPGWDNSDYTTHEIQGVIVDEMERMENEKDKN